MAERRAIPDYLSLEEAAESRSRTSKPLLGRFPQRDAESGQAVSS